MTTSNSTKKLLSDLSSLKTVVAICILLLFTFITYNLKVTGDTRKVDFRLSHRPVVQLINETKYKTPVKCSKTHFDGIVLIVNFNYPFYNNIPFIKEMYSNMFKEIFFCGPAPADGKIHNDLNVFNDQQQGIYGYMCMVLAYKSKPNRKGYLYTNDDMIVNWWNLINFNLDRMWQGSRYTYGKQNALVNKHNDWSWWPRKYGLIACRNFYLSLKKLMKKNVDGAKISTKALKKFLCFGEGQPMFTNLYSDFFYVPSRFAQDATFLFDLAHQNNLFLELAVPAVMRMLGNEDQFEQIDGYYFPERGVNSYDVTSFWTHYNTNLTFVHPFKFNVRGTSSINKAIFEFISEISREKQKSC